ncbi:hypothetical protein CIPAW_01G203300 [Carya illinoinensis]|uniref:Uncharacterized protein n=1 Tax=Carya illinoinensis TaxID=32201 RepID=A0A8T1RQ73_CARIL|nr:hypothetical protein CIPAW_01G203300 [Carya illinoinensis]
MVFLCSHASRSLSISPFIRVGSGSLMIFMESPWIY